MTASERAAVLVYDGFAEIDAIGPYDVFATAARQGVSVEATLVAAEPCEDVEAIGGLTVDPDGVLDPADPPDCLLVPGGRWSARANAGAWAEAQRGVIPDMVAACHDAGSLVAGVGAGVLLLAEGGLGDDPEAHGASTQSGGSGASHRGTLADGGDGWGAPGAPALDARLADDGRVRTVEGTRSGIDLALSLLEHAWGPEPANEVASMIEYDPDGDAAVG